MTGFGKAEQKTRLGLFNVEVSSVNNRFLEVSVRQPRQFSALEYRIKEAVGKHLSRGKIYIFVGFTESEDLPDKYSINVKAAEAYSRQLKQLQKDLGLGGEVTVGDLLAIPDLAKSDDMTWDLDDVWKELSPVVTAALKGLASMRKVEGAAMAKDMSQRLKEINEVNEEVSRISATSVQKYRDKLKSRVGELAETIDLDPGRLEQEVALLAERSDISEECTRLASHVNQYQTDLNVDEPVGKRLNFILQEMNREANTIASKCTEAEITRAVITLKEEIEKLRELVQNVE